MAGLIFAGARRAGFSATARLPLGRERLTPARGPGGRFFASRATVEAGPAPYHQTGLPRPPAGKLAATLGVRAGLRAVLLLKWGSQLGR